MTVIGVDSHKKTHTLVGVDDVGRKLDEHTVKATDEGHAEALRWARSKYGAEVLWAIEDCRQVTTRLESALLKAGQRAVRVWPRLTARTRRSARTPGKSDPIDALQVARAALREPDLPVAFHDKASREMNLLVDRREVLVEQRTAMIFRLLWRMHELDPARGLKGSQLTKISHRKAVGAWLSQQSGVVAELAGAELADIAALSEHIDVLTKRIVHRAREVAPSLVAMPGCGELTAAKIVGEVAVVTRFRSADAFAAYAGVTPVPHSSGGYVRRRAPVRPGNRQLNRALHTIAQTQCRWGHAGKAYYQKRLDAGDSPTKARRALKRRIAHAVYHRLLDDQRRSQWSA
ncbi:transposase (plasmid) [Mycobacterium sp. JS623]|uniref:IS110 family transposase n=1 Tax=Mycobacterium sp. JS623 TaxID=212767 RepID=UPI0002A58569|nr:IS110 family transposase [Mycobacterium sp. JS623]AGB26788.1 transposase [Mycobacterium sp. JS623]